MYYSLIVFSRGGERNHALDSATRPHQGTVSLPRFPSSFTLSLFCKNSQKSTPLFSNSSALFKQECFDKPFAIKVLRTLLQNTGVYYPPPSRLSVHKPNPGPRVPLRYNPQSARITLVTVLAAPQGNISALPGV
jgi:hypothetical protein